MKVVISLSLVKLGGTYIWCGREAGCRAPLGTEHSHMLVDKGKQGCSIFLVEVEKRDAATLLPLIYQHVRGPGSTYSAQLLMQLLQPADSYNWKHPSGSAFCCPHHRSTYTKYVKLLPADDVRGGRRK